MKPLSPVPLVVSGLLLTGAVFAENQAVEPATVNKSVNLALSQTQNNETKTTEKTPYIIRLADPSIAQYSGGISGF